MEKPKTLENLLKKHGIVKPKEKQAVISFVAKSKLNLDALDEKLQENKQAFLLIALAQQKPNSDSTLFDEDFTLNPDD